MVLPPSGPPVPAAQPPAGGYNGPPMGGYSVPPARGFEGRRLLWLGLLIAVCALSVIGIVTYVGWNIGPVALGVGIAGALLPVPVLVGCFLWLDRYDPSPLWIIIVSFLWGAGVATSGALVVNTQATHLFEEWGVAEDLVAVLVAPFIEELLKAAFPLLLFAFYRKAFTGIIDGIVYCGLSATGFAMVENILYLGGHGFAGESEKGYAAGAFAVTAIFILRVPLTGFAHPLFTSLTGIGLGIAARSPSRTVRVVAPPDRTAGCDDAARRVEPHGDPGTGRAVLHPLWILRPLHADLLWDGRARALGPIMGGSPGGARPPRVRRGRLVLAARNRGARHPWPAPVGPQVGEAGGRRRWARGYAGIPGGRDPARAVAGRPQPRPLRQAA